MSESNQALAVALVLGFCLYLFFKAFYMPWVVDTLCDQDILIPEHCTDTNKKPPSEDEANTGE